MGVGRSELAGVRVAGEVRLALQLAFYSNGNPRAPWENFVLTEENGKALEAAIAKWKAARGQVPG